MKITKLYPDCELFGRKNGYWVSCPRDLIKTFLALTGKEELNRFEAYGRENYLSDRFTSSYPDEVEMGCYYFLIAEDCSEAIPLPPYYRYSGQWNAYNPFLKTETVQVTTLEELRHAMARLSEGRMRKHGLKFVGTEDEFIITPAPEPD